MNKVSTSLFNRLAACVTTGLMCLGLLACAQGSASAAPIVGTAINLTATLTIDTVQDFAFFDSPQTGVLPPSFVFNTGIVNTGVTPFPTIIVPLAITNGTATAMGLVKNNTAHVVIALGTGVVFSGISWDTLFPSTPEASVAAWLQNPTSGNLTSMDAFFAANEALFVPFTNGVLATGNFAEFTNGVGVGTLAVSVAAVPEPSTGLLMSLGLAGFALLAGIKRRSFQKI